MSAKEAAEMSSTLIAVQQPSVGRGYVFIGLMDQLFNTLRDNLFRWKINISIFISLTNIESRRGQRWILKKYLDLCKKIVFAKCFLRKGNRYSDPWFNQVGPGVIQLTMV